MEVCESRYDRVLLTVVDTPGLDFHESRELNLEWQVSSILKYVDQQYADTLSEVSPNTPPALHAHRLTCRLGSKSYSTIERGSTHSPVSHAQVSPPHHRRLTISSCLYMINPHSVMSTAERKALSSAPGSSLLPMSKLSREYSREHSAEVAQREDQKHHDPTKLAVLSSELRVIKRLSQRVNVLPIIGCADSLTDERLSAVKEAVRTELAAAGLDFGVFGPPNFDQDPAQNGHSIDINLPKANARPKADDDSEEVEEEEEERKSRGVIRLKPRFPVVRRSRSRTRRDTGLSYTSEGGQNGICPPEEDSVANVRFSASLFQRVDLSELLPFALISPEKMVERVVSAHLRRPTANSLGSGSDSGDEKGPVSQPTSPLNGDGHGNLPYLEGPPADLRGVFVRKFRWGTIDVLNPDHCDFAALRTAVMSTHMMVCSPSPSPL